MGRDEGMEWLRSRGFLPSHDRLMGETVESMSIVWSGVRWRCAILSSGIWAAYREIDAFGSRCVAYGDSPSEALDELVSSIKRGGWMMETLWRVMSR